MTDVLRFEAGHPAFPGHFPGQPIVPGVLLLDAALAALAAQGHGMAQVAQAKFLRPVGPGEALTLALRTDGGRTHFDIATVEGGHAVATGQLKVVAP